MLYVACCATALPIGTYFLADSSLMVVRQKSSDRHTAVSQEVRADWQGRCTICNVQHWSNRCVEPRLRYIPVNVWSYAMSQRQTTLNARPLLLLLQMCVACDNGGLLCSACLLICYTATGLFYLELCLLLHHYVHTVTANVISSAIAACPAFICHFQQNCFAACACHCQADNAAQVDTTLDCHDQAYCIFRCITGPTHGTASCRSSCSAGRLHGQNKPS